MSCDFVATFFQCFIFLLCLCENSVITWLMGDLSLMDTGTCFVSSSSDCFLSVYINRNIIWFSAWSKFLTLRI